MKKFPLPDDAPNSLNAIIEIPANSGPIKYEYDHHNDIMLVDRFMPTSMSYPCNYGFIPSTLSGDGDPLDVLVHTSFPIIAGAMVKVRPIGVLFTEDESGQDEKILSLPDKKIDPFFGDISDIGDINDLLLEKIKHFFESYKNLEKGKWVKVQGWGDANKAKEVISSAIQRYKAANNE